MSEYSSDEECLEMPRQTNQKNNSKKKGQSKEDAGEDFLGMKDYLKMMDKELATTTIGESFEKKPKVGHRNT